MSDTIAADVLDGVYDLFAADTTLAGLVTALKLRIFDGPPTVDFAADSMLVVGGKAEIPDEDSAVELEGDWATLGVSGTQAEIDELIRIPCGIASMRGSHTGDTTMRQVRRTAFGIYAAAGSALRGSTLSLPRVMWCFSNVSRVRQWQTASGPECLIDFTAFVRTRI